MYISVRVQGFLPNLFFSFLHFHMAQPLQFAISQRVTSMHIQRARIQTVVVVAYRKAVERNKTYLGVNCRRQFKQIVQQHFM